MNASKHVGRAGALAVALGIGTALTAGTGVAWADDGGSDTGKISTSSSEGKTRRTTTSATTRKGPLSKIADRIHKDVGGAESALKRSSHNRLGTSSPRADIRVKVKDESPQRVAPRASSGKLDTTRVVPEAAGTVPDLHRTKAPNTVVVKVKDATAAAAQHNPETAPTPTARLSPLEAGTGPVTPGPSPALWAVMAWARRETERTVNPNGTTSLASVNEAASVAAVSDVQLTAAVSPNTTVGPNQLTPKPAAPQVGQTTSVGWVTGDSTASWFVGGTDLGIMWDNGAGKILTIFGDTFDDSAMTTGWRNNVLFRTGDRNLGDGLQFDEGVVTPGGTGPGTNYDANMWWGPAASYQNGLGAGPIGAAQVILASPALNGLVGTTYTMIPTSAISVTQGDKTTQYVTVMSVRTWDNPGSWTTNYSAIAYSTDGGEHWTVDPDTVRASGFLRTNQSFVAGNQNFQQNALVYGNADDPNSWTSGTVGEGERYVYVYGTPSGRQGSAYVARVAESDLTNLDDYEYWSGEDKGGWVKGDPSAATSVIGGGNSNYLPLLPKTGFLGYINKAIAGFVNGIWVGGIPTGGNVSEMSVQYNEYLGKYVVLYTDGGNNVVMRVSDSPQGEWSDATVLVANNTLVTDPVLGTTQSGMYAPMIHPWSGTDQLGAGNEQYLYYNLSYWGAYNVALKQTDLSPMKIQYT